MHQGIRASGYCYLEFKGKCMKGSRLAYMAFNRQILTDDTVEVLHSCRSLLCCNPEHLTLGTHSKNMGDDKERDGTELKGELHPMAKIDREKAEEIKLSKGDGTQQQRAEKLHTTIGTVKSIDQGRSWKE
jgi:hypothetical protein